MDSRPAQFRLILKSLLAAAGIALLLLITIKLRGLLVLVFGAVVIGVLIHGLAQAIARRTPLSERLAFYAALLLIVGVFVGFGLLFGAQIAGQFTQLTRTVPETWERIQEWLGGMPGGATLMDSVREDMQVGSGLIASAPRILGSLASALTDFFLVLFGAIFIAANPGVYRRGLTLLFPRDQRALADEALGESGTAIKLWMGGQLVAMVAVGSLTALGLWLVGVPAPFALGILMGLFEIIPWLGPFLGAIPILIMALSAGPETALMALGVILIVQQLEGNVITPFVQKHVVALPPALTIFGVIAGGILFGVPGLFFAAPLLVVIYVLVKRLYIEEALDTPTSVPGRDDG